MSNEYKPIYWREYAQVILEVPDRATVIAAIEEARRVTVAGSKRVMVHHTRDNVKALMDLGPDYANGVDAPIQHLYEWSGRYTPFEAQAKAAGFLTMHDRAFNLSEMGTGKTLAALWAFDYLRGIGVCKKMLVISPLSTVTKVWADDSEQNLSHLKVNVLAHPTVEKRLKLLNEYADIYVINHDGVKIEKVHKELMKREDIDLVVIDELTMVGREKKTGRWKAVNELINGTPKEPRKIRAWGLTGAPTPNRPSDAWGQVRLISPERVSYSFNNFRESVMRKVSQYRWEEKGNASELVAEAMQPSIRFRSDECIDLPPCMISRREVPLSPSQKAAYEKLRKTDILETDEGTVICHNAGVSVGKLLQVCSGAVNTEDTDTPLKFDISNRLKELINIIDEAEGKTIVFSPYINTIEVLYKELTKDEEGRRYKCVTMSGKLSTKKRNEIVSEFKKPDGPQVLIGQPDCMAHGLTLVAANVTVWWTATMNNDTFIQANARTHRPGQERNTYIILFEGGDIEKRMFASLESKGEIQDAILAEVKDIADDRGMTVKEVAAKRKALAERAKEMQMLLEASKQAAKGEAVAPKPVEKEQEAML